MSSPPPVIDDFTNTTTIAETTTREGTTHTPCPLQPQQSGEEDEDEKAHSEDWDELAMTEERAQRLKLAAPEVTEVLPWLYVGGEAAAKDRAQLLAKGITAIVNTVAFDLPNYHEDLFHYLDLFICDSPDEPIFCVFPLVNAFIERTRLAGGRTFVHCHQGVSRSCALVIAYVMWKEGMCYDEAYAAVRRCRNVCSPNTGFYVHLHLWERHLTTPVRSRAYAYVPYSATYAFPFAFRLALTFSALQNSADETHTSDQNNNAGEDKEEDDDEGAHLFNPAVQRVTTRQCDCSLDPRLSYGFLLPNATNNKATLQEEEDDETQRGSVGVDQPTLTNFLWHGDACPSLVASQAELAWWAFLRYNFYHGPPHESVNDRGERVYFAPATDLHVESEPQVVFATYAVESQINHWFALSSSSSTSAGTQTTAPHCSVRCGPDAHWDPLLLASADLAAQLTAHVAEETRRSQWSPQRKRAREEEQRRLPVLHPLASRHAKTKQAHDVLHHTDSNEEDNNVIEHNEEKTASSDTPHTSSSSSSTTSAEGYLSATSSRSLHADMNNTTVASQAQHGDESEQRAGNEYALDEQVDAAGRNSQRSTSEQASTHEVIEGERVVVTNLASDNAIVAPQDTSCDMEDVAAAQDQEDRQHIAPNATMPFVQADDATPAVGTSALDFEVYVYPFTHKDMVEVIGMADLSPETCYAILLPATAFGHNTTTNDNSDVGNGDVGNQIYLWIGEDSAHDATTAMKAFERNLAIKPHRSASARASRRRRLAGRRTSDSAVPEAYSVKLSNGSLLKNATVSVVYEGEEPDDLLLVLD